MPKTENISPLPEPGDVGELIALYQPRLHAYVLSLVFDPQVAADIVQDTNLILWKKAAQFTPGTNFKAWAFRIAFFEVKSYRRKAMRNRIVFDDDLLGRIAAEAEEKDEKLPARRRALAACLPKLPDRQREIILLRYFRGMSVVDIAKEWNRKANAIGQLLFRARQNLMNCMTKLLPDESR